ncbi:MAG: M28 family metallopeptidase [Gemmatimonadota bacterium]
MTFLALASPVQAPGQAAGPPPALRTLYDSAYFAWDRGDYVQALEQAERLLEAPGGDALLQQVALLTGELFEVAEIAPDGRFLRWSPDGRHLSFETGSGGSARTHIVSVDGGAPREIAAFAGWAARFAPAGDAIAYLRVPETAALGAARERQREAAAAGDAQALAEVRRELAELEATDAEIAVRRIESDEATVLRAPGIERFGLEYTGDGSLVLLGRRAGEGDRIDLFQLAAGNAPRQLTSGPGYKGSGGFLAAGPEHIVYTVGTDRIAVHHVPSGGVRTLPGAAPAVSADGSTLAYLSFEEIPEDELRRGEAVVGADVRATGAVNRLMVLPVTGSAEPRELLRTTLPLASPALSPSGQRVAYNTIPRDDWEVFVANTDGSLTERLTREIQHDLFPHFLSETAVLTLMGEARHRRSYLHEIGGDRITAIAATPMPGDDQRGRIQLFDNNTLRTVTPQYEWVPSPDGSKVAVVADRDGDTLSPERGVYLVDLESRVTGDAVLARVRTQLAAERALREWGRGVFAPIEPAVREVTAAVDPGRVYDHAHALYQFGSKFITQPGNALAIEYLANSLRSMGYEPELQWFEPRAGIRSANVVATLRGTERPERINVLSSHFDSVERSPGADDNTSGTTALLEVARVLAGLPQPETIRFAFLTGEESGLLGGREFVRLAVADGDRIVAALNNDMIGWTRSHRLDNTIRYSNDAIRDLQHNAAILFSDLITYDARYVRSTDAQAFWDEYGDIIGGIGSYPILGNPHYHQPHDQLEVIDHRLVAEVARTTAATLIRLANGFDLVGR